MICKKRNPLVKALSDLHFSPITLPSSSIQLLDVVEKNDKGGYSRTTKIDTLFDYDVVKNPLPQAQNGVLPQAINQKFPTTIDAEIGLSLLQTWIGQLAGVSFNFNIAHKEAKTVEIQFLNTEEERVDIADLNTFLDNCQLKTVAKAYQEKVKNNEIYVMVSLLKSNSFSIKVLDAQNNTINLGANQEQIGSAKIKYNISSDNQTLTTYQGEMPLVFGVKCYQIICEDKYYVLKEAPDGLIKSAPKPIYLKTPTVFLDI